ncbi:MAG: ABC transporter ATP-binding protein [Acidimicrobiales bacterium]
MTDSAVIDVTGLSFSYGERPTLADVDLCVAPGEIHALLGPNGSGKTTLINLCIGLLGGHEGRCRVLGSTPGADRDLVRATRLVPQGTNFEPTLTVAETLAWVGGYHGGGGQDEVRRCVEAVGLTAEIDRRIGQLSGGQQRRVDIASALLGRPELVFLDEPTANLDVEWRSRVWELIEDLAADGTAVLLTTHDIDEAEALAHRVTMLRNGRVVSSGTTGELLHRTVRPTHISLRPVPAPAALPDELARLGLTQERDGRWTAETIQPVEVLRVVTNWLADNAADAQQLVVRPPRLEEVYIDDTVNGATGTTPTSTDLTTHGSTGS